MTLKARLERLERTVGALVDRLDAQSKEQEKVPTRIQARSEEITPTESNLAPVILIREAATDAGVSPPGQFDSLPSSVSDVISAGLVTSSTAHSLLKLLVVIAQRRHALFC